MDPAAFEPAGELTLRDAMAAALLGNPELAAFAYEVRAAEARVLQAGLWSNPELGVEVENIAGSGELEGVDAAEVTLGLSQTFPLGGDIERRRRLAALEGRLAGWDYEAARVALLAEVVQRYVNVLAAQRRVELARESLALAEQVAALISRRVEAGDAPPVEVSRAQVTVATARIAVRRAQRALETARVQLALTWGNPSPRFDAVVGDLDRAPTPPPVETLAELISQNLDVARWATEIASRQAAGALARAEATPDLTASLGYRWFSERDETAFVAGVSIPLPVFDRRQGDFLASRFGVAAARRRQQAAERRIEAALAASYARLAGAHEEAIALRDQAIPPAREAYEAISRGFERGDVGILDVLDAEHTLIELRQQYVEALAAYHGAVAEIECLIGQSLETIGGATDSASTEHQTSQDDQP